MLKALFGWGLACTFVLQLIPSSLVAETAGVRLEAVGADRVLEASSPAGHPSEPAVFPDHAWVSEVALRSVGGSAGLATPRLAGVLQSVQGTVTGRVTDATTGQPLQGAQVVVVGTSAGAITDQNGSYTITGVPAGAQRVQASRVGYTPRTEPTTVSTGGRAVLDFALEERAVELEGIVAVGYGTQRRENLTGAVGSITEEELQRVAVTSFDQAIQGRVAGVEVTQTSAQPGGATRVRIRGGTSISAGNEPLYVVDGFPIYNNNADAGVIQAPNMNALATLNPNDIESIEVLKDAAATAIYGSRGANGVVMITTRRGRAGQNNVEFESSYGLQQVRRMIPVLNARQYAEFTNERWQLERERRGSSRPNVYTPEQVASFGEGTNWQEELFRTAPVQNHQLSVTGGDAGSIRYALSGGYTDQQGVVINSDFQRYSLRLNLDKSISSRVRVGNTLTVSRTDANVARTGGEAGVQGANTSVVAAALYFNPILPVRDPETGQYTRVNRHIGGVPGADNGNVPFTNPVAYSELASNKSHSTRVLANLFGELDLAENLTFRSSLGADIHNNRQNRYEPSVLNLTSNVQGRAIVGDVEDATWLTENLLTYSQTWADRHDLTLLGGVTAQASRVERLRASATGFADDNLEYHSIGAGQEQNPSFTGTGEWSLLSYLSRANYSLDGKYLISASFRADGSSRFGAENRWGYFPSAAVAWRLSEEPFLRDNALLSDLKLRTSYGVTGNQEIGLYEAYGVLETGRYVLGGSPQIGFAPANIANPGLRWETTSQIDAGFDVGLLENRLRLTADYYQKDTDDLLLSVQIPATSGFGSSLQNVGSVRNRGVELAIDALLLEGRVTWDGSFNISSNRTRVVDLGVEQERLVNAGWNMLRGNPATILQVGEPIGNFFGWETDGFFQTADEIANAPDQRTVSGEASTHPGTPRLVDQNNDGVVNHQDRVVLGNAQADFTGGFSSRVRVGALELSTVWAFSQGNEVYNFTKQELYFGNGRQNASADWLNRWAPSSTPEENARAVTRAQVSFSPWPTLDTWIEDASFLRMRDLTLSVDVPVERLNLPLAQRGRLYIRGQNLLTFTDYSGFDPEVNIAGQDNVLLGFDYSAYPAARTYMIGLNLGF